MKRFLLTSIAVLISCAAANAEIVIDNFNPGGGTLNGFSPNPVPAPAVYSLNDDVGGTRTTTVGAGSRATFGTNAFLFESQVAGTTMNLTYALSSSVNLFGPGKFLMIDLFRTVQREFDLDVTLTSSTAAASYVVPTIVFNNNPTHGFRLDANGAGAAIASTVDGISITLTKGTFGGYTLMGTPLPDAKIAAVPEPASLMLLGMTGLGGWFVARRRNKKAQTAA